MELITTEKTGEPITSDEMRAQKIDKMESLIEQVVFNTVLTFL